MATDYKNIPNTPERILRIRQRVRDRVIRVDSERSMLVTEAYKANENVVPIIKHPLSTLHVCQNMTCRVEDEEFFVANTGKHFLGSGISSAWEGAGWIPEMIESGRWTIREDGLYHNPDNEEVKLCISQEDYENLASIQEYWKDRTLGAVAEAWKPDGFDEIKSLFICSYAYTPMMTLPCGHLTPGFDRIINTGYGAIRKRAQDWMDARRGNLMGEDMDKYMFYKSVTIVCDAATTMIKRYAKVCFEKAAQTVDVKRKQELEQMGAGLEWISENPARTFWEALQGVLMYRVFLTIDAKYPAIALGRLDQYTWPYLEADLAAGRLTMEQAQTLLDGFFLKANCMYFPPRPEVAQTIGIGNTYQHTTIGGVNVDTGEDATNPVTYMVLDTMGRLKLHDPTISLRINKNTPEKLWMKAIETSKAVGGLPLFQNDDVIIPGLQKELGFELRDARNYSIIGCQEIVGSGCDYPAPNGVHATHTGILFAAVMAMALNNGKNPLNGAQCSIKTGYLYEMKDIEEVKEAVRKLSEYLLKWVVTLNNYTEYISMYTAPHAALSISIEGCMEKGMDCTRGGAKYNSYGGTATGLATVADSMAAIKYMCFDKKLCTTRELYDAIMDNWQGHEELRKTIIEKVPHYGNDDPYADEFMNWICGVYRDICGECHSVRSKVYKAGLYGSSDHVVQGKLTWATADGRHTGEPIADAASPSQSRDFNGPTAIFLSSTCFDHSCYMDGMALNIRIHPTSVGTESDMKKLYMMTKAYFDNGGMEVQYNIVSTDTMRAAQETPDDYRDLVVRIAGYSAYFVELSKDLQDDIISRNENVL